MSFILRHAKDKCFIQKCFSVPWRSYSNAVAPYAAYMSLRQFQKWPRDVPGEGFLDGEFTILSGSVLLIIISIMFPPSIYTPFVQCWLHIQCGQ